MKKMVGIILGVMIVIVAWTTGASFALFYFAAAIYTLALIMIPGYIIASLVFKDCSTSFKIAASTAVSSPIYAIAILFTVGAGPYRDWLSSIFALLMICGSLFVLYKKQNFLKEFLSADKNHLKWFLLLFFFTISLMALPVSVTDVPYLSGHSVQETRLPIAPGDQYLPYRFEQILLNGADWKGVNFYGIWTVADRPPLMGLVAAFVSSSLHVIPPLDWVWNVPDATFSWNIFQVVGCMLGAQIILSSYLILSRIFGVSKARLAMPFLAISPFIIWNTFYTSPKSMAAYFLLLSLFLIMERKVIRSGVIAALGFLSHSYALFYIIGFLFLVYRKTRASFQYRMRNLFIFLAAAALTVAPWMIWSSFIYGHTSSFILYPLASTGPDSTLGPSIIIENFLKTPKSLFIWVRVVHAYRTLFPWTLALVPEWFIQFGWYTIISWTNSINQLILISYIFTIPGGLSFSLALPAYLFWIRSKDKMIFASVTFPVLFAILFFGYPTLGLSGLMAQPLIPILVGGAILCFNKRIAILLFATLVIEYLYFIWGNIYPANLLLTNLQTASDLFIFTVIIIWAIAVAKMSFNVLRGLN